MSITPFGETVPRGSLEFNLRFADKYYDKETETHYNINRDYNPVIGRYIQADFIGKNNDYGKQIGIRYMRDGSIQVWRIK